MSYSEPVTLYQAPKQEGEETPLLISSYDNENLILLFHMLGFKPQRVVTEDGRLLVYFLDSDCVPIKTKIYAAEKIPLDDYSSFIITRTWWRDMISLAKETRRNGNR